MKVLIIGATHPVAKQLTEFLNEAGIQTVDVVLPEKAYAMANMQFAEHLLNGVDMLFLSPHMPKERLSFRRRLQLVDVIKRVCHMAKRSDIPCVHLSHLGVYDGRADRAYNENDKPSPNSHEAKIWRRWEVHVQHSFSQCIVLRPGWLLERNGQYLSSELKQTFGYHSAPDKVPYTRGNPISPFDIGRIIFAIMRQLDQGAEASGIFHFSGKDVFSSAQLLQKLAPESYLSIDESVPALNYELDCKKILNAFGVQRRHW